MPAPIQTHASGGIAGYPLTTTGVGGGPSRVIVPAFVPVSSSGGEFGTAATPLVTQSSALSPTAGTDLSGTATTTSGGANFPADANRKPGDIQGQNVGTVVLGFNEFGGTAVIGNPGTYQVRPGDTFSITTNRAVNFIAASGTCPFTATRL